MRAIALIVVTILLTGCTAQVSGMQSPVLHDYGTVDWIPVTRDVRQAFITGSANSAAVQNDSATTPAEYQARLAQLPDDARNGELTRLRVGLRLSGRNNDAAWNTGARIQLAHEGEQPLVDVPVDELPRSGDWVEIVNLPDVEPGAVLVIHLIPGSGPDADRLQMGFTPWRAPHGGWRATTAGEEMRGAMVFDTRYERDVDMSEILRAGVDRFTDSGTVFLTVFTLTVAGLLATILWLWRMSPRKVLDGR